MVRNVDPIAEAFKISAPAQFGQRTCPLMDRQIDEAISAHVPLVDMNMSAVQMIDSAGLNWLIIAQARLTASNISLRLTHLTPLIDDILMATRLDVRLNVHAPDRGANA